MIGEVKMVKALLLHIGVDQSTTNNMTLGVNGPIFDDGTFEFIPILELLELPWSKNTYFLKKGERIVAISDEDEYVTTSDGKKLPKESTTRKFTLTSETRTYLDSDQK